MLRPNNQPLQAAILRILLDEGIAILALEPLERPLERLYLQAVRGLTPEAVELAPAPLVQPPIVTETDEPYAKPARRPGEGDTLLNELLRRDGKPETNVSMVEKDTPSAES